MKRLLRQTNDDLNVRPTPAGRRRGVAAVLAMMFLVLFASLAAVMAVVAQGNVRTAHSSLRISRALSGAESGRAFATTSVKLVCSPRRRVVPSCKDDWSSTSGASFRLSTKFITDEAQALNVASFATP